MIDRCHNENCWIDIEVLDGLVMSMPPALAAAEAEVADLGADTLAIPCDVSDADAVEQLAQQCVDHFGAIHIACNNAGVFTGGHLWEASRGDYDWLIQVNLYGVINGIRSFIPRMLANGQGYHMVNTASMAAVTTTPYSGIYHMTKHAVLALSECLYHELAISAPQVGVSCLCPELFSTGIGNSERNRPAHWGDALDSESRSLATEAIVATVAIPVRIRVNWRSGCYRRWPGGNSTSSPKIPGAMPPTRVWTMCGWRATQRW